MEQFLQDDALLDRLAELVMSKLKAARPELSLEEKEEAIRRALDAQARRFKREEIVRPSLGIGSLVIMPDGSRRIDGVTLDSEADRALLEQILAGKAPLPIGTKELRPPVDLRAQIPAFLAERRRTPESKKALVSTLNKYLASAERNGLPADSRGAAAAFKAELIATGIGKRTLNFHLMKVSAFMKWATNHEYADSDPAVRVKVAK